MPKKKISYVLLGIFLLLCISIIIFCLVRVDKKVYNDTEASRISSIQLFDDNKFVLVSVKDARKAPSHIIYGQNFISTFESHSIDTRENKQSLALEKDEYYKIVSYDLNSNLSKKELDIYSLLDSKERYRIYASGLLYQYGDGRDYVYASLYRYKNGKRNKKQVLIDIGEGKLVSGNIDGKNSEMTANDPYRKEISLSPGGLWDSFRFKLAEYHLWETNGTIRPDVDDDEENDYRNKIDISNTNFAELYPDVAKNMKDINRLYFRPEQYNQKEWFDNLLHWFAPKGQDVMEVYATDSATGEKTQIKSFDEYLAWREAHPEEVKNNE